MGPGKKAGDQASDPLVDAIVSEAREDAGLPPAQTPASEPADLDVQALIDELTDPTAVDVGDKQAYVFHSVQPNVTYFFSPRAREHAENQIGGQIDRARREPAPIKVDFRNSRYVTTDAKLAELMTFCIKQWPDTYRGILSGHAETAVLAQRISTLRSAAARQQLGAFVVDDQYKPLIDEAERANAAGRLAAAEALLDAAENASRVMQAQRVSA